MRNKECPYGTLLSWNHCDTYRTYIVIHADKWFMIRYMNLLGWSVSEYIPVNDKYKITFTRKDNN